jgi:hypothetical protein
MTLAVDMRAYNIALTIGVVTDELRRVLPDNKRGPIFELLSAAQNSAAQLSGDLAPATTQRRSRPRASALPVAAGDNVVAFAPRSAR